MSKFDDDLARGCLPTGEPLESLYGVGWWTEHDEPIPYPYDLYIAELESRIAELEAENAMLKQLPQPIKFWSDEKKQIYKINERRTVKSGSEERGE